MDLLGRMRETVLSAVEHRDLPFAAWVEALRPLERRVDSTAVSGSCSCLIRRRRSCPPVGR